MAAPTVIILGALVLAGLVEQGSAQARCFSLRFFSCDGPIMGNGATGQECCDQGFLAFEDGSDICTPCSQNGVCSSTTTCSEPFDASRAQNNAECCAISSGVAYTNSQGQCVQCPTSIDGCFPQSGCDGASISLSSSGATAQARECCVSTTEAMSYSLLGQCFDCTVYGFLETRIEEPERGQGYEISIGYLKRPASAPGSGLVRGEVQVVPGGTASVTDYQLSGTTFTFTPTRSQDIIITFSVDSIAQEPAETLELQLEVNTGAVIGAFLQDRLDLVIIDSDRAIFQFTEADYSGSESDLAIETRVSKNLRIANPVEFLLTPYTVDGAIAVGVPLDTVNVPPDDNPFSPNRAQIEPEDRRDFSPDVIVVRFEADESASSATNEVTARIPIVDDEIDENQEENFIVDLTLLNSTSEIEISRRNSLVRISDNDDIRIGFQQPSYTFPEPLTTQERREIFLEKENGTISERTFVVEISIVESFIPGTVIPFAALATDEANNDYVVTDPNVTMFQLIFPPDAQTLPFNFTLFGDDLPEGLEMIEFTSSVPIGNVSFPTFSSPTELSSTASVFIEDDDRVVIGLEQNYTVSENDGIFEACVRILIPADDQPLYAPLNPFVIQTSTGSAGNEDFSQVFQNVSLSDSVRRVCVNVSINTDNIYEETERFSVSLRPVDFLMVNSITDYIFDPSEATVDILDTTSLEIGFINAPYSGTEDGGVVTFEVGVTNEIFLEREVVVDFSTVDGDAIAGSDYVAISNLPLTFGPSSTNRTVSVTLIEDNIFEFDEMVGASLSVSNSEERLSLNPATAQATITDDDVVVIGFRETSYNVNEDAGSVTLEVAVLEGEIAEGVELSVNFTTADESAIAPGDYSSISQQLLFSSTLTNQMVSVVITDDAIFESSESFTGSLQLVGDVERVTLQPEVATVNIQDNDAGSVVIGFRETSYNVSEDDGSVILEVAVLEGEIAEGVEFSVSFATSDGSAIAPGDYTALTRDLVFSSTSTSFMITVDIIDDDIYETLIESFTGSLQLVGNGGFAISPGIAMVNIRDDNNDSLVIGFRETSYNVNEDTGSVTLEVAVLEREIAEGVEFSVSFATTDGSAIAPGDYTALTRDLVFSSTSTSFMITVDITNDDIYETLIESFTGSLQLVGDVERVALEPGVATVNIQDDNADALIIGFGQTSYDVNEDAGSVTLDVAVLEGEIAEGVEFSISFATADGSAIAPGDYSSVTEQLLFSSTSTNQIVSVVITDDAIFESLESFTGSLQLVGGVERVTLQPEVATVNIQDNDAGSVVIGFRENSYNVNEDAGSVTLEVAVLEGEIAEGVEFSVNFTTADGSAIAPGDYTALSMVLVFSSTSTSHMIPIDIINDVVFEQTIESFSSSLELVSGSEGVVLGTPDTTINILDQDEIEIGFVGNDFNVNEDAGSVTLEVAVLEGEIAEGVEFSVNFATADGTAIAPGDYIRLTMDLVFSSTSTSFMITIDITDDDIYETLIESFTGSLQLVGDVERVTLEPGVATVSIQDDNADTLVVGFRETNINASEDDGSVILEVVVLEGEIAEGAEFSVNFTTADGSAIANEDYTADVGELIFTSTMTSQQVSIDIIDDNRFETDSESFSVTLELPDSNERITINPASAEVLLTDDDVITIGFEAINYTVTEGTGSVELVVGVLSGILGANVEIFVSTRDVTAVAGTDYIAIVSEAVELTPSSTSSTVSVTIQDDSETEPEETFQTFIVTNDNRVMINPNETSVVIIDNDRVVTGVLVNDTVIGDPLMTVPLFASEDSLNVLDTDQIALCYEIHGRADQFFNLVTDECTSVNSHYIALSSTLNVINQVGVRAISSINQCHNILVSLDGCTASIDGTELNVTQRYMRAGISVRRYSNRVRISVPNCNDQSLVMWVMCESRTLDQITTQMIEFAVMRGLNFGHSHAHGLVGQFWNVPAEISPFTGFTRDGNPVPDFFYRVDINSSFSGEPRSYIGSFSRRAWEDRATPCLYVGNRQGGPIYEVTDPNDSVIEGRYSDYRVDSAFSEDGYSFGLFNNDMCVAGLGTDEPPSTTEPIEELAR